MGLRPVRQHGGSKSTRNPVGAVCDRAGALMKDMKKQMWQWFKSVGSTLAFVWVFTHSVAQATVVPTESMNPTILVGDHFFLDKLAFPANYPEAVQKYLPSRTIHRGDIVALWSQETPDLRLVKRVIGLPGETLEVRHRDVYINGH